MPNASPIADSDSANRCGASKNTIVRGSRANSANRADRAPPRLGKNPSKQNRSTGSPDNASAVVTADGPGRQVTATEAATAATTNRYPGSEIDGMPASVTSSTRRPAARSDSNSGARVASLASK